MAGFTGASTAAAVKFAQTVTLDVSSVPANSVQEESFAVNGLDLDDTVIVTKPTRDTGLYLIESRVSAADTLALSFLNMTGAAINPASQDFIVVVL